MSKKRKKAKGISTEDAAGLLAAAGVALLNVLARAQAKTDDPEMVVALAATHAAVADETVRSTVVAATGA